MCDATASAQTPGTSKELDIGSTVGLVLDDLELGTRMRFWARFVALDGDSGDVEFTNIKVPLLDSALNSELTILSSSGLDVKE